LKNSNKNKFLLISLKRERKRLKRKRKDNIHINDNTTSIQRFRINYETKIITNFKSKLFQFLVDSKFVSGTEDILEEIVIPYKFCLEEHYNETVEKIGEIILSIWENVVKSKDNTVNLNLLLCGFITPDIEFEDGVTPINSMGFLKGKKEQKSYLENKKGINATIIVKYIDECLRRNSFELSEIGKNDITGMIGEILSNAEDHSPFSSYYVTANYTQISNNEINHNVGLLNLSFLNFGYSIYEGLLENKIENAELFDVLRSGCSSIQMKAPFTDDNLFTLFALQDGVSRLKFSDESRGTGTMKFINCFFSFGDYQNNDKKQSPYLSILSGNTQLVCDNKYKPFEQDNKCYVSLNDENDLSLPPKKSHLKDLKYKFPGTLLSIKAFLNEEHISKKIINNG
jgi:hypothetical protein